MRTMHIIAILVAAVGADPVTADAFLSNVAVSSSPTTSAQTSPATAPSGVTTSGRTSIGGVEGLERMTGEVKDVVETYHRVITAQTPPDVFLTQVQGDVMPRFSRLATKVGALWLTLKRRQIESPGQPGIARYLQHIEHARKKLFDQMCSLPDELRMGLELRRSSSALGGGDVERIAASCESLAKAFDALRQNPAATTAGKE